MCSPKRDQTIKRLPSMLKNNPPGKKVLKKNFKEVVAKVW